jgi:hypothetical protein
MRKSALENATSANEIGNFLSGLKSLKSWKALQK